MLLEALEKELTDLKEHNDQSAAKLKKEIDSTQAAFEKLTVRADTAEKDAAAIREEAEDTTAKLRKDVDAAQIKLKSSVFVGYAGIFAVFRIIRVLPGIAEHAPRRSPKLSARAHPWPAVTR